MSDPSKSDEPGTDQSNPFGYCKPEDIPEEAELTGIYLADEWEGKEPPRRILYEDETTCWEDDHYGGPLVFTYAVPNQANGVESPRRQRGSRGQRRGKPDGVGNGEPSGRPSPLSLPTAGRGHGRGRGRGRGSGRGSGRGGSTPRGPGAPLNRGAQPRPTPPSSQDSQEAAARRGPRGAGPLPRGQPGEEHLLPLAQIDPEELHRLFQQASLEQQQAAMELLEFPVHRHQEVAREVLRRTRARRAGGCMAAATTVGVIIGMVVLYLTLGATAMTIDEAHVAQQRRGRLVRAVAVEEEHLLFRGYDCSGPANVTTLTATDDLNCQIKETDSQQRKRHYALLHQATSTRFQVTRCTMTRSRMVYHCWSAGHTAMAPLEWQLNRPKGEGP